MTSRIADLWARAETMRRFGYFASYHALADRALSLEARFLSLRGAA